MSPKKKEKGRKELVHQRKSYGDMTVKLNRGRWALTLAEHPNTVDRFIKLKKLINILQS